MPIQAYQVELEVKRSKFLTFAAPATNREEADIFIKNLRNRHPQANHVCWAYIAGAPNTTIRSMSDDGEPSGTAGMPILNVVDHSEFSDIAIIVVRYFGGTKLGTGGLARAYSEAASSLIKSIKWVDYEAKQAIRLHCQFQQEHRWINIRVTEEVLGGTWDSLIADSSDLIIGATGEPYNNDFFVHTLGTIDFVFAVAKNHPLVDESQPISDTAIKQYSSIVVADSSRNLPTRSVGLLDGLSRITVPTMQKKIEAHLLGVGVGFLPIHRIQDELESGELVPLQLASYEFGSNELSMAWRKDNQGKALAWFIEKVQEISNKLI